MGAGCCTKSLHESENNKQSNSTDLSYNDQSPRVQIQPNYKALPNRFGRSRTIKGQVPGIAGLENLGNTCYIGSAIQCLSNCQPLIDYFLAEIYTKDLNVKNPMGTGGELTLAFAELVCTNWQDSYDCIVPKHLVRTVWKHSSVFKPEMESDVHEFMIFMLEKLHEDLNRASRSPTVKVPQLEENTNEEIRAAKAWQQHLKCNSSVIVDLFQGQFKSTITCSVCNQVSTKFDVFQYLSLSIPSNQKKVRLEDCISEFTKNEELEEGWNCLNCNRSTSAFKRISIWKVPPILILLLKRFEFTNKTSRKLKNSVKFPLADLSLEKHVEGLQREPPVYNLFAKVDHQGNINSGHYTTTAKNRKSNKWYIFDDEHVSQAEKDDLVNGDTYMLFYHKASVQEYWRQSKSMPDHWPHVLGSPKFGSSLSGPMARTGSIIEEDSKMNTQTKLDSKLELKPELKSQAAPPLDSATLIHSRSSDMGNLIPPSYFFKNLSSDS